MKLNFSMDKKYIENLKERTGRETNGEVILDALSLYSYLLEKHEKNKKIYIGSSIESEDLVELSISSFK